MTFPILTTSAQVSDETIINISPKFIPEGPIDADSALVQIIA